MILVCQKLNRFFTRRLREYSRYFRSIVRYGTKIVFLAPRRNLPRFDISSVAASSTSPVRLVLAVSSGIAYLADSAREGEWTRRARGGETRETICRFNVASDLCRSLHVPSDSFGCICTLFRGRCMPEPGAVQGVSRKKERESRGDPLRGLPISHQRPFALFTEARAGAD